MYTWKSSLIGLLKIYILKNYIKKKVKYFLIKKCINLICNFKTECKPCIRAIIFPIFQLSLFLNY